MIDINDTTDASPEDLQQQQEPQPQEAARVLMYAASTGGFYDTGIHDRDVIPTDAREITRECYEQLHLGQSKGMQIVPGTGGEPMLKPMVPSTDDLAAAVRAERNARLVLAGYEIEKAEDAGQDTSAWRRYRQALRDLPAQPGFPTSVTWPTKP